MENKITHNIFYVRSLSLADTNRKRHFIQKLPFHIKETTDTLFLAGSMNLDINNKIQTNYYLHQENLYVKANKSMDDFYEDGALKIHEIVNLHQELSLNSYMHTFSTENHNILRTGYTEKKKYSDVHFAPNASDVTSADLIPALEDLSDKILIHDNELYLKIDVPVIYVIKHPQKIVLNVRSNLNNYNTQKVNGVAIFNFNELDLLKEYLLKEYPEFYDTSITSLNNKQISIHTPHYFDVNSVLLNDILFIDNYRKTFHNLQSFINSDKHSARLYFEARDIFNNTYENKTLISEEIANDFIEKFEKIKVICSPEASACYNNYKKIDDLLFNHRNLDLNIF